jgi:hypothetical protein
MWIKLGQEYLNMDHVVRVRFVKTWKNGQEDMAAELEAFVTKGELQVFCRYRGAEAKELHAQFVESATAGPEVGNLPHMAVCQSSKATLPDIKLPVG